MKIETRNKHNTIQSTCVEHGPYANHPTGLKPLPCAKHDEKNKTLCLQELHITSLYTALPLLTFPCVPVLLHLGLSPVTHGVEFPVRPRRHLKIIVPQEGRSVKPLCSSFFISDKQSGEGWTCLQCYRATHPEKKRRAVSCLELNCPVHLCYPAY